MTVLTIIAGECLAREKASLNWRVRLMGGMEHGALTESRSDSDLGTGWILFS